VVLSDPFRGTNSVETQQSGHTERSEPEIKNGGAKDGALEKLRCRTIQKEVSYISQMVFTVF